MAIDWLFFLEVSLAGLGTGALLALTSIAFVLIYKATEVVNFAQGNENPLLKTGLSLIQSGLGRAEVCLITATIEHGDRDAWPQRKQSRRSGQERHQVAAGEASGSSQANLRIERGLSDADLRECGPSLGLGLRNIGPALQHVARNPHGNHGYLKFVGLGPG